LNILSCARLRSRSVSLDRADWPNAHDAIFPSVGSLFKSTVFREKRRHVLRQINPRPVNSELLLPTTEAAVDQ
jgi:hypothetical protein